MKCRSKESGESVLATGLGFQEVFIFSLFQIFFRFQSMFLKCDVLCVSLFCPTAEFYGASASLRIWGGSWVGFVEVPGFGGGLVAGFQMVPGCGNVPEGFGKVL